MQRHFFQIEHLRTLAAQCPQQAAFAASGRSAHDTKRKLTGQLFEVIDHCAAKHFVASVEQGDLPADARQNMRHGAAAIAAAPAVDQRFPAHRVTGKAGFDMAGDVAGNQNGASFAGLEGIFLVEGANEGTFLGVQDGITDRAGEVIFGEFGRAAGVNDGVEGLRR